VAFAAELAAVAPASQASAPLPAAAFFRPAAIGAARLSPSGRWLALTAAAANGRHGLAVMDLHGDGAVTLAAHYSDMDVADFHWVNDDRLVFNVIDQEAAAGERRYAPGLFSVRRDGGEIRQLVQMRHHPRASAPRPGDRTLDLSHGLLHVPAGGGDEVIVGEYRRDRFGDPEALLPKRLNVVTGRASSLARGMPDYATRWLFDAQGEPRVASATRDGRLRIYWRADVQKEGTQGWAEIANFDATLASWEPHSLDAAGRLYVTVPEGAAGERVLKRFDFASGQPEREALVVAPGFDFSGSVVAETTGGSMLAVRAETDAETTVWSDPRMKALQDEVDRRLPGRINSLSCRRCREAEVTVLVHSWSDRDPGRYWVWRGEPAAPTLWRPIGAHRKGIEPQRMAAVDFQRYRANDGREIPVWITTPAGHMPGQRLPAVVLAHGGPWLRGAATGAGSRWRSFWLRAATS
jgi:dipeptidyl aminopeptidase/acylaminoacyl peptidase